MHAAWFLVLSNLESQRLYTSDLTSWILGMRSAILKPFLTAVLFLLLLGAVRKVPESLDLGKGPLVVRF